MRSIVRGCDGGFVPTTEAIVEAKQMGNSTLA